MKTTIYLVRHAETEHNINNIISGQAHTQLTTKGRQQAKDARKKFQNKKFDAIYTSDQKRAVDTAEIIHQKPIRPDNQLKTLRERSYGSIYGKHNKHLTAGNEFKSKLPENDKWHFKHVHDMESDYELATRYLTTLKSLARKHKGETLMVVAHGNAIKIVLKNLLGLPNDALPSGSFANTGHAIIEYENGKFKVLETPYD